MHPCKYLHRVDTLNLWNWFLSFSALTPKSCTVNGVTYKDGDQFQLDCSKLCTCQNGIYGCVSLCPQEHRKPSEDNCPAPHLMPIPGQCCKEWTCQPPESMESVKLPRHASTGNGYGAHFLNRSEYIPTKNGLQNAQFKASNVVHNMYIM